MSHSVLILKYCNKTKSFNKIIHFRQMPCVSFNLLLVFKKKKKRTVERKKKDVKKKVSLALAFSS